MKTSKTKFDEGAKHPATPSNTVTRATSAQSTPKPTQDTAGHENAQPEETPKKLRAVGYCRTSGEGQRDNTSIPVQKQMIEEFVSHNGWKFVTHYVDECKTGKQEEGREAFLQMMRDAALGNFDLIAPFKVGRFSRDGVDILGNAKFLKQNFGIHVVDTKGQFDSRSSRNILSNFVHAGVSEHERISIMERMIRGRIDRAKAGKPWSGNRPFGRDCETETDKWSINERGLRMRRLLERYAAGESLADLLRKEFTDFSNSRVVLSYVRNGQLSGTYVKEFNIPELEIKGLKISIPQIPEVITEELEARVRDRSEHRRTWNKENRRTYVLTGFIRCGHCETALTGNTTGGRTYYRHCTYEKIHHCVFHSIRGEELVDPVLDYLFTFFTDEKEFNAAVSRALPDASEIDSLERERDGIEKRLSNTQKEIDRLVDALVKGADASLLIGKQQELKERRERESTQLAALTQSIASTPDRKTTQLRALEIRLRLLQKVQERDWRKLPLGEIKQFLIFLFGENASKSKNGIRVTQEKGRWRITFQGKIEFHHELFNGRPVSHLMIAEAERHNKQMRQTLNSVNLTRQT